MDENVPYERKVYRCDSCQGVLYLRHISEGGCPQCGGRRIKYAVTINDEERSFLEREGYEFNAADWMDQAQAVEKQRMEREVR